MANALSSSRSRTLEFLTHQIWVVRILVLVLAALLLEVAVRQEWVDPFFVPPPSEFLVQVLRDVVDPVFLGYVAITFYEVVVAFILSVLLGTLGGYLLWRFKRLGDAYEPMVAAIFASPIVLLYPIFIIFFGRTSLAIIALATTFSFLPIILFTRQGLAAVSPTMLKVGASMNISGWATFRHILVPAAAPTIFTGLRIGVTYILIVVIAMEYILSLGGLGFFVSEVSLMFRAAELYSGVTLVVLISATVIYATYRAERLVRR